MSPTRAIPLLALAALALATGCPSPHHAPPPRVSFRADEAEVAIYLDRFPPTPLALDLDAVAVVPRDGVPVPLALALRVASAETAPRQRLLASGRVPPGTYTAVQIRVRRARVGGGDLSLPEGPLSLPVDLAATAGRGEVVVVSLRPEGAVRSGVLLSESALAATRPQRPAAPLVGLASLGELDGLAVFDRRARGVVGLLPTSPRPQEIALDDVNRVAYVAAEAGDRVEAFDLVTFEALPQSILRPGDRPLSVALAPDGTTLVVANAGSESLSFVDPVAGTELQRVQIPGEPVQVLLDRLGKRAFVVLRRAAAIAIVDVASRAVVRTFPVEARPTRILLSPAADQLVVAYAEAPFVTQYALPAGRSTGRVFTGPGVTAIGRDPSTGNLLVAARDASVQVFDPATLLPIFRFELPAPAARLGFDAAEGTILALLPSRGSIAVVDARSRRLVAETEVGPAPRDFAASGVAR